MYRFVKAAILNLVFVAGLFAMSGPAAAVTADQVVERYSVFDFTIVEIDLIADETVFVVAAVQDGQAVVFFVDAESGEAIADNETIQRLLALMQTGDAGADILDWFENQVEDLVAEANHAVTASFRMLAEIDAGDQLVGQLQSIASRLLAGVEQAAREAVAGFEGAVREAINPEWLASRLLRPVESALRDLLRQIERLLSEVDDNNEGRDDGVVEEEEVADREEVVEEEEEENEEEENEEEGEPDLTEWIEAIMAEVERAVAGMFAEAEHAARDLIEAIGDEIAELPEELQPAALQALEALASLINGILGEAEGIAESALQSLADAMEQHPDDAEALAAEALDIAENALREALAAIEAAAG